jgi:DivIVA domain-containing protein
MQEISGQEIRSVRFPEKRRGYQSDAVDRFLEDLAQYVDVLRGRLAGQELTERSAMLLLQKAQITADQTVGDATAQAEFMRAEAEADAREVLEAARAEARQRMSGAEAQIEAAFADASARLNEVEKEISARRRELAMLEAGSARFAADQAAVMRQQADVLLEAAASITAAGSTQPCDALVVEAVGVGRSEDPPEDGPVGDAVLDLRDPVDNLDNLVTR